MTVTQTDTKSDVDAAAPVEKEHLRRLLATGERPAAPSAFASASAFAWRSMLKIKHVPEQLGDILVFPIMMLLMFTYLFGGAIAGGTVDYLQFLLPGNHGDEHRDDDDVHRHVGEHRHPQGRLGPVQDAADLAGRADGRLPARRPVPLCGGRGGHVRHGMVMGYRPEGGAVGVLSGVALLLVFCFAFSWLWTWLGLITRSEKTVMSISMSILFPLTFLSNVMVDPSTMPGWLQPVVKNTPISQLVDGVRGLFDGNVDSVSVATTLIWSAGFIAVFGFLTIRAYNRK